MADSVDIRVSDGLIKPIIEAKIQTAIAEALRGHENLIANAVARILAQKVDHKGMPSDYSGSTPFVEWLAKDAIHRAAKVAIAQWADQQRESLTTEFLRQMKSQKSPMAKAFVNGLSEAMSSQYRIGIDVSFKTSNE